MTVDPMAVLIALRFMAAVNTFARIRALCEQVPVGN